MTENEAKGFMLIEKECINRDCNRDCIKCDIVQTIGNLNIAYNMAIKALEEIQQYREIEREIREHYQANVDIKMIMKYFIETIFKSEKHERFCILTNEDADKWDEYKKIGTPEECRAKTLTVDKAKTIAARAICIGCGYLTGYECSYKGGNCMVSKPMLESVSKSFDDWNARVNNETD